MAFLDLPLTGLMATGRHYTSAGILFGLIPVSLAAHLLLIPRVGAMGRGLSAHRHRPRHPDCCSVGLAPLWAIISAATLRRVLWHLCAWRSSAPSCRCPRAC